MQRWFENTARHRQIEQLADHGLELWMLRSPMMSPRDGCMDERFPGMQDRKHEFDETPEVDAGEGRQSLPRVHVAVAERALDVAGDAVGPDLRSVALTRHAKRQELPHLGEEPAVAIDRLQFARDDDAACAAARYHARTAEAPMEPARIRQEGHSTTQPARPAVAASSSA